jgi:large subunit ribosomal protein L25
MITLAVTERKTKEALSSDRIPAVFYGPKEASTSVSLVLADFERVLKEAGESTIISLSGVGEEKDVLIHDVDYHPVTGIPRHVDFYAIEKGKKLTVEVALVFVGTAPAIKEHGGSLVKVMHDIEIEALPKDLPNEIEIDISTLVDFESTITIADVVFPDGVKPTHEQDETVVAVSPPREEEEEEGSTEIDMDSIEVEKKGKAESEDTGESSE